MRLGFPVKIGASAKSVLDKHLQEMYSKGKFGRVSQREYRIPFSFNPKPPTR